MPSEHAVTFVPYKWLCPISHCIIELSKDSDRLIFAVTVHYDDTSSTMYLKMVTQDVAVVDGEAHAEDAQETKSESVCSREDATRIATASCLAIKDQAKARGFTVDTIRHLV